MDGIEILNSYQIIKTSWGMCFQGLIFLILLIICAIIMIHFMKKGDFVAIAFFVGVFFFFVFSITSFSQGNKTKTTRYEVIISDEVSYNKFIEKYNVIEQRGKIFVVEEK